MSTSVSALALLAIDPHGLGGAVLRGAAGSPRDGFVDQLRAMLPADAAWRRLPISITDDRLHGALDLATSLQTGRRVQNPGILSEADGGIILLPMAETMAADRVAKITSQFDQGPSRFAILAFDEGVDDATMLAPGLADRLAFWIDQDRFTTGPIITAKRLAAARVRLPTVICPERLIDQLTITAAALGIASIRAPILAVRAARVIAALAGHAQVTKADAQGAARLVLAPRATRVPATDMAPPPETEHAQPPAPDQADDQERPPREHRPEPDQALAEQILAATIASIPADLLARLAALDRAGVAQGGGAAPAPRFGTRGRPVGARAGKPGHGARLALLDTLRAAAPWQRLRRRDNPTACAGLMIKARDFRLKKFKEPTRSVAIVSVDASGSSALHRLAEAKGAIQLLLAECYVRRDQVALIAFRNRGAEILLPPTSALARARRSLAGLPGGGATPLASGIDAARQLALCERRRGKKPLIVLLTDGGANIGRDGQQGRKQAINDALEAATGCALDRLAALVIDTAPRPSPMAHELAQRMRARHFPLPFANAGALQQIIRTTQGGS